MFTLVDPNVSFGMGLIVGFIVFFITGFLCGYVAHLTFDEAGGIG
jgi:hypothetical protein